MPRYNKYKFRKTFSGRSGMRKFTSGRRKASRNSRFSKFRKNKRRVLGTRNPFGAVKTRAIKAIAKDSGETKHLRNYQVVHDLNCQYSPPGCLVGIGTHDYQQSMTEITHPEIYHGDDNDQREGDEVFYKGFTVDMFAHENDAQLNAPGPEYIRMMIVTPKGYEESLQWSNIASAFKYDNMGTNIVSAITGTGLDRQEMKRHGREEWSTTKVTKLYDTGWRSYMARAKDRAPLNTVSIPSGEMGDQQSWTYPEFQRTKHIKKNKKVTFFTNDKMREWKKAYVVFMWTGGWPVLPRLQLHCDPHI